MRSNRWPAFTGAVLGVVLLAACGVGGEAGAVDTQGTEATIAAQQPSVETPRADAPEDVAACAAFADVMTIVENADLGLADGRMATQEHDGWFALATRVLDRLPSSGDSAVQRAIGELQEAAPAAAPGTSADPTGVGSPQWQSAQALLDTACADLGTPLAIDVFTGG